MSTISSLSSSSGASYATALAQTSKLGRELNSLGAAVQKGDLTGASSALSTLLKDFPEYAPSTDSTASQGTINQDLQTLSDALTNKQSDAAQTAWTQLKSDLASANIIDLNASVASPAQVIANSQLSEEQSLVSALFGTSSSDSSSISTLLGTDNSSGTDSISSLVSNWMTYKVNGTATAQPSVSAPTNTLNATA